jgi:3'(2'), 5'-bisphosphate nucleotidase
MAPPTPYSHELHIALLSVQRASLLTKRVLHAVDKGALDKSDASPVTIADFGAQALLISAIHHNFPSDRFIGEEAADALRADDALCERVWKLVESTHLDDEESEGLLGAVRSKREMLDLIDLGGPGKSAGADGKGERLWILDPVDGTAAFMKGQQYAVCLALAEGGEQKIGVLGCPNLKLDGGQVKEDSVDTNGHGLVLSAVQGQGACIRPMSTGKLASPQPLDKIRDVEDTSKLRWVDSVSGSTITPKNHRAIAEKLGASWPGTELWSMQMKYVALAVGACDVMVRIPPRKDYRASVWDHAGGQLILREAGGMLTDTRGEPFDFGLGRKLQKNFGLVAASARVQAKVLDAVKEVIANSGEEDVVEGAQNGRVSGA